MRRSSFTAMDHRDHVHLIRNGVPRPGGLWADFGAGSGAFTLALADILGPTATIHALDRDRHALQQLNRAMRSQFPQVSIRYHHADYTQRLDLPLLDGLVMANALHFQQEKQSVIELLRTYLRPGGHFIIVEYDTDNGNRWVPYPISFFRWQRLAAQCGLTANTLLQRRPSRFLGHIYAALSINEVNTRA